MTVTTAHEPEGVVVPPPVPAAAATAAATPVADVVETTGSDEKENVADEKQIEADPDMQKMIAEAQKAADDHAVETQSSQDVDFSGLLAKLDGKADAPRHETPRNPKGNRKFGFGGGRRHHNNDRGDRHEDRRVENVVAAPAVAPVSTPTPVVHNVAPKTADPEVEKIEAVTPKSTPVAQVVEDAEIADLRRRARPVFDAHRADMAKANADANKWKKIGAYLAAAALVALVGYGLMKFFGGGDVAREVPHVPVIAATPTPTTPPAATAADVLGEKFDKLNHRLDETMPTSADLALLDSKITEAENAAITQIAHVPCFKDPDQPRCRKAVNTERDYFESDFSHPRDVALGKIPYTPPTNKVKPAKKAGKTKK